MIRLSERVAGRSSTWEIQTYRGPKQVSWQQLGAGLRSGRYTGIESVRRIDGDWGPLFGRPMFREVFGGKLEPRELAKKRAAERIERLERGWRTAIALCGVLLLGSMWGLTGLLWLLGLGAGVTAGWVRMGVAVRRQELATLIDRCVPPVTPPPPVPEDWAQLAAADEVEAVLREHPPE